MAKKSDESRKPIMWDAFIGRIGKPVWRAQVLTTWWVLCCLKIMKRKIIYISIFVIIIATCAVFYFYKSSSAEQARCPDDYATDDAGSAEYLASMDKWTNDFYDAHPGSSLSEWATARHQFWVDNDCTLALQRYEQAKNNE